MLRIGICDDNREDIARIRELAVRFSEEHPETPVQIHQAGLICICWMSLCRT